MSVFNLINSYEEAWKSIIMPPRQDFSSSDLGFKGSTSNIHLFLGSPAFYVRDNYILREDIQLYNKRGHVIECTFYQQAKITIPYPCVVYLHGNGCSRVEALEYLEFILANPASYFIFDFTGCGKSGGTYSSVGWFEQDDLECVLNYLQNTGKVSKICLWGRSMGATTALLYSSKQPKAECLILDSPFADFKKLIMEIANKKVAIPNFLTNGAFHVIRKTILKQANFDIDLLKPIENVQKVKIPALFGVGKDDNFVSPHHTEDLYLAYPGKKKIVFFEGSHNTTRPFEWLKYVLDFIKTNIFDEKAKFQENKNLMTTETTFSFKTSENLKVNSPSKSFRNKQVNPLKFSRLESKESQDLQSTSRKNWATVNQSTDRTTCPFTTIVNEDVCYEHCSSPPEEVWDISEEKNRIPVLPFKTSNEYKIINGRPSIRIDPATFQGEVSIKNKTIWKHRNSKSPLGPKLVMFDSEDQNRSKIFKAASPKKEVQIDKSPDDYRRATSLPRSRQGFTTFKDISTEINSSCFSATLREENRGTEPKSAFSQDVSLLSNILQAKGPSRDPSFKNVVLPLGSESPLQNENREHHNYFKNLVSQGERASPQRKVLRNKDIINEKLLHGNSENQINSFLSFKSAVTRQYQADETPRKQYNQGNKIDMNRNNLFHRTPVRTYPMRSNSILNRSQIFPKVLEGTREKSPA